MSESRPSVEVDTGTDTGRSAVLAWSLWDWGSSAYHAVTLTFIFSVYLTDAVGDDLPGSVSASSWFAWAIAAAGVVIAVTAPVAGQRFDAGGSRRRALGVLTALTVASIGLLFFVRDDYHYLWFGLLLVAFGSVTAELAQVPYNAMLRQVSTPETLGRVSGLGWSMGYFGGIVLLLLCYVGFVAGDGDTRGVLGLPTEDGLNIRLVAVLAAVWFAVFALPVLRWVPELPREVAEPGTRVGVVESYRVLFRDIAELWRADRRTVLFLWASAVFRDGLNGVFTFGAILAVSTYGFASGDVLIFGIAANVVAGVGALVAGRIDDRVGSKPVIVFALAAMLIDGLVLLFVEGPTMFWVFGLVLCLFVGPAQSSSRTFLAALTPVGREGQAFGLYATTGRAVSFLSPVLFGLFAWWTGGDRGGIVGLLLVLAAGLALLLPVRGPARGSVEAH